MRRAILSYFCGGAVLLGAAVASFAGTKPMGGKSLQGPIYNSATSSYFQLYKHPERGKSYRWDAANIQAKRHSYKGKQGRLAIVKDPQTLEFLREKFSFKGATWIGLRFFCKYRKLMWVDGEVQSPKAAGMWHKQWYRNRTVNCNSGLADNYMPIYMGGHAEGDSSVFWQASGPGKGFYYYMVEYPAPKKSEDVSQNSKETPQKADSSTAQ